jgi:hypothetical protein
MSKRFSVLFKSAFTILFACSAIPAFAQHGGGGHSGGGGFHGGGGGGFHGGGGMHSSGGGGPRGGSYSGPPAGYVGSRGAIPSAPRSGGEYPARPGNSYSRPGSNFAGGNQRYGSSPSTPNVAAGQWHSFGGPTGGRGSSGAASERGPSTNAGDFHVFSGNRGTASAGAVRSFSGQGGEVWENAPAARNVVPRSQSLSTFHNSVSGPSALNSRLRSNSTLSASSSFTGASPFAGNRGFSGGVNSTNSFQHERGTFRFGNRFNRFNRFGGGCWNCGFGFGFGGWGFGWPWLGFGFGFADPFWYNPWWGVGPAYGYGYYGYPPNSNVYSSPDSGYSAPDDNSNPPPEQDSDQTPDGNWVTPNGPSPALAPNSGSLTVPVLIYMKNGSVLTVRDYWMIDGDLHYILMSGAQRTVNLELVDLPRTNTENAKSGVKFIFKSQPSVTPAEPDGNSMPPGASEPSPKPAPTQQLNAVPQPEART